MKHDGATANGLEDIAIVGMACILPRADTPAQFWHNIVNKVDCTGEPPAGWAADASAGSAAGSSEPVYTSRGAFLGDLSRFQAAKYGVMPSNVEGAEPDQFLALRCAYEALADAGVPELPFNRDKTGVILGRGAYVNRGSLTWIQHGMVIDQVLAVLRQLEPNRGDDELALIRSELKRNLPPFNAETVSGLAHCVLTGRIANRLDLHGPTYTLDSACASTLMAVEQGMDELRSGRCDAVLAGGVQVSTPVLVQQVFCHIEALSRTGKIAPFSAASNGTLLGEGCGILVLKRRRDAERDGNRIYALLKAVGVAADGKGAGLLAPRTEGQQLAIRRAYEQAGLDCSTVALVEAHGTGIPLGDQTEVKSLRACFGSRVDGQPTIALGSVKSMIGHLIPAAGAASLIKTALALYHRTLPPMLHAEEPNPALGLDQSPFYLSTQARPWIHGDRSAPRRAGVNAFGFGGINAHAILEEHQVTDESTLQSLESQWPVELVVVSGADLTGLRQRVKALADWLARAGDVRLLDMAATCAVETGPCRIALIVQSKDDLVKKLEHVSKLLAKEDRDRIQDRSGIFWYRQPLAAEGRVAFVFPGEGAQYPNMLADLCRHFPEVRREFDLTDEAFLRLMPNPQYVGFSGDGGDGCHAFAALGDAGTIQEQQRAAKACHPGSKGDLQGPVVVKPLSQLIFPPPEKTPEAEAELFGLEGGVVSVTAAQRALLALLGRLGIQADAIVGHSSGEFGALLAAGSFVPADENALIQSIADGVANAAQVAQSGLVPSGVQIAVGGADPKSVEQIVKDSGGRLKVAMDNCPHQVVLVGDEEASAKALEALKGKNGLCQRLPWDRLYHTEAYAAASRITAEYYDSLKLETPKIEMWSCATADRFPREPEAVRELAVRQWSCAVRFRETVQAMHRAGVRMFVEVGPRGNLSAFISDTLGQQPHAAVALDVVRRHGLDQLCRAIGMLVAHGVPVDLQALYCRRNPRVLDLTSEPPAVPAPEPHLNQALPVLKLGNAVIEKWQAGNRRQAEVVLPQATPPVPKEASAAVRPVAVRDPRAAALADYQRTMQQFLETQQQVTLAHLATEASGKKLAPVGPVLNGKHQECSGNKAEATPLALAPSTPPSPPTPLPPPSPFPSAARSSGRRERGDKQQTVGFGAKPVTQTAPAPAAAGLSLQDRLREIVSERTGYPLDMLDLNANLEADLGIDSIKRVEIIGAFRRAELPALTEPPIWFMERMTAAKTLQAILGIMNDLLRGKADGVEVKNGPAVTAATGRDTPASFPFVEKVLIHEPNQLLAECELDIARHRFLLDHTFFGRNLSVNDPSLSPLPVMPLAMMLELMAEAVLTLRPGQCVAVLRDVKALRRLTFETPARRVRMKALADEDGTIRASLLEADHEGMEAVLAEAAFELAATEADLGPATVPNNATTPFPWPQEELYGRILYHGTAFQGIVSVDGLDRQAARGIVKEPDPALLVPAGASRLPVLPVVLLDVAGQLAGLTVRLSWTNDEAHLTFPSHIERLEFARRPSHSTPLRAVARVRHEGARVMSDVEMTTPDGQVVLRALGRTEDLVKVLADLYGYWPAPREVSLSRVLREAFHDVPGAEHCTVCEVGDGAGKFLVHRFWSQVLARLILSAEECRVFANLKLPPVPAACWLLGRMAVKDAVRLQAGLKECMADVTIVSDEQGRPKAKLATGNAPHVSLAHKESRAVAVAADPSRFHGVGIDLEPLAPLDEAVKADAFTARERTLIAAAAKSSGEPIDHWYLALWGAKEAVGKALGRGVLGGPRNIEAVAVDVGTGRLSMVLRETMAQAFPEYASRKPIEAYRRLHGTYVIALCLLPS